MDLNELRRMYPYLSDKPFDLIYTPNDKEQRYLETYPPGEPGAPDAPRPKELPIDRYGVQVFRSDTRPLDILGDYVSHVGVYKDPTLKALYEEFKAKTPDSVMRERYKVHRDEYGETRPYKDWLEISGYPELFRGYTFDQFGPNGASIYSPDQLKILNQAKEYLGIAPPPVNLPASDLFYKDPFGSPDY